MPPGTGVISPALPFTELKSQSPFNLPPSETTAASKITAPFFIKSPVINPGFPALETIISALLISSFKSFVFKKH